MNARENLRTALNPGSVAIVGASDNPDKIGGARGLVSGGAARLREARLRTPGHEVRCTPGVWVERTLA
jgi:hypothetical protein